MTVFKEHRTLDQSPLPLLARTASLFTLVAGLWLVAAPHLLNYTGNAATWVNGYWNDTMVGTTIAIVSLVRLLTPLYTAPLSLATAALGGWLIVAPSGLGYNVDGESPAATANDITIGIVVVVIALASWLLGGWVEVQRSRRRGRGPMTNRPGGRPPT